MSIWAHAQHRLVPLKSSVMRQEERDPDSTSNVTGFLTTYATFLKLEKGPCQSQNVAQDDKNAATLEVLSGSCGQVTTQSLSSVKCICWEKLTYTLNWMLWWMESVMHDLWGIYLTDYWCNSLLNLRQSPFHTTLATFQKKWVDLGRGGVAIGQYGNPQANMVSR